MTGKWFEETLHPDFHQRLKISDVLHHDKDGLPGLPHLRELRTRPGAGAGRRRPDDGGRRAILAHGEAKRVLIIGGGDGGALEEALKHPIEKATVIEINPAVVELSKKYLPSISAGAFDDPRTELIIWNGTKFVATTEERLDVILVDSTDPVGPAMVLFQEEFYANCKRCLTERGILITQSGVPFLQAEEARSTNRHFRALFADHSFYLVPVPSYVGGFMTFGWASLSEANRAVSRDEIERRYAVAQIATRYYNLDIHLAAFALPNYIRELMG